MEDVVDKLRTSLALIAGGILTLLSIGCNTSSDSQTESVEDPELDQAQQGVLWMGDFYEIEHAFWTAHQCVQNTYGLSAQRKEIKIKWHDRYGSGLGLLHPTLRVIVGAYVESNGTVHLPRPNWTDEWEVDAVRDLLVHECGHLARLWAGLSFEEHDKAMRLCMPFWYDTVTGFFRAPVVTGKPLQVLEPQVFRKQ